MTEENEEDFKNKFCRFCEKELLSDKARDHCHLTCKYRGPAHNICKFIVIQKQSKFIQFVFHNFSKYYYDTFFKKLLNTKLIK